MTRWLTINALDRQVGSAAQQATSSMNALNPGVFIKEFKQVLNAKISTDGTQYDMDIVVRENRVADLRMRVLVTKISDSAFRLEDFRILY